MSNKHTQFGHNHQGKPRKVLDMPTVADIESMSDEVLSAVSQMCNSVAEFQTIKDMVLNGCRRAKNAVCLAQLIHKREI